MKMTYFSTAPSSLMRLTLLQFIQTVHKFSILRPFFKESFKCFTFHSINRTQYDYLTTTRVIGRNGFVNSIKIRDEIVTNRSKNSLVFYSVPGTLPRSSPSVSVTPLDQTIQLTVDYYKSDLLPAPYESNCYDYTTLGMSWR